MEICVQRHNMRRDAGMPPERSQAVPFVAEVVGQMTYSFDHAVVSVGPDAEFPVNRNGFFDQVYGSRRRGHMYGLSVSLER